MSEWAGGSVLLCAFYLVIDTVEPLYKGHIETSYFVHCREVVHSSEVKNVLAL